MPESASMCASSTTSFALTLGWAAAHLVDRVLPEVPIRQWVLSLPWGLRYRLAYDAPLVRDILGVFVRSVFASLRRRARTHWGVRLPQCGAITFVQRFGDALNLNVHFHSLVLDGIYARTPQGALRFHPLPPPDHAEVARVAGQMARRLEKLCRYVARPPVAPERLSRIADGMLSYRLKHRWRDGTTHVVFEPQELLEKLAALVPPPRFHLARYHGILGPCASERDRVVPAGTPRHGEGRVPGDRGERGSEAPVQPSLEDPPAAAGGGAVEPAAPACDLEATREPLAGRGRRLAWAELLRRVFAVDLLECPRGGGRMRVMATIHTPEVTQAILECLGLPARAPPTSAPLPEDTGNEVGWDQGFDAGV